MDKENLQRNKSPLKQTKNNLPNIYTREDSKCNKHDQILSAIEEEINSNSCNILDVILSDPLIKELNLALEKQAEQQKKNKLLQSFPHRYRSLLNTQCLYMKLQESLKEVEKQSKQVISLQLSEKQQLLAQIQYFQHQVSAKQQQNKCIQQNYMHQKKVFAEQFEKQLQTKDKELLKKKDEINDLQRKLIKTRCQKQNMIQYLEEMKEQTETLKKQNQRIIHTITNQQLQINALNQQIIEQSQEYTSNKQQLIQQSTKIQVDLQNQIYYKTKQCSDLIRANEAYQCHLKKREQQIQCLKTNQQIAQASRYQQIQQVRNKLLQSIQQKNQLDQSLQKLKQSTDLQLQHFEARISELQQSLVNKDIQISQKSLQNELQVHKIKQMVKKIEDSKDQTIQQIRQNVNFITQEKLSLQAKCLKLQIQKESIIAHNQKLKNQLDAHEKKMLQIHWNTRKSEVKGVEIQKMVSQFKQQLSKFQQIINEKEEKIQQYRKQIISLRAKIKTIIIQRDQAQDQLQNSISTLNTIASEKDKIKNLHSKCSTKENSLIEQIEKYKRIVNRPKQQRETQFEVIQGINDQQQLQLVRLQKQLQKTQLKYQNILEDLQEYKKQFKEQITQRDTMIKELQENNKHIKQMLGNKLDNNSQISKLLNTKIQELKAFYEKKMQEEDKKYRKVIDVLKTEVTELYKEIDLKKSMEEQMFNEIMKINKGRKAVILQDKSS